MNSGQEEAAGNGVDMGENSENLDIFSIRVILSECEDWVVLAFLRKTTLWEG